MSLSVTTVSVVATITSQPGRLAFLAIRLASLSLGVAASRLCLATPPSGPRCNDITHISGSPGTLSFSSISSHFITAGSSGQTGRLYALMNSVHPGNRIIQRRQKLRWNNAVLISSKATAQLLDGAHDCWFAFPLRQFSALTTPRSSRLER